MDIDEPTIDFAIAADGTVTQDASTWDQARGIAVEIIKMNMPMHAYMAFDTVTDEALQTLANLFDRHGEHIGWLHNTQFETSYQVDYRGDWFKLPEYFRQWYGTVNT